MGADTKARLLGYVKPEEIVNFIYHNWDKNVIDNTKYYNYNDCKELKDFSKEVYDDNIYSIHGFISFKYKEEKRSLFYNYNSYNAYENLDYYSEYGLKQMVKSETTFISLGKWGDSIEIIEDIVKYFGGWFDPDDCDDEPYYYIPSIRPDKNKEIQPIIYMTQEELNKHFGGIVVIKD